MTDTYEQQLSKLPRDFELDRDGYQSQMTDLESKARDLAHVPPTEKVLTPMYDLKRSYLPSDQTLDQASSYDSIEARAKRFKREHDARVGSSVVID